MQRAGMAPVPGEGTVAPGAVCGPNRADAPVHPLLKHTITLYRESVQSVLHRTEDFMNVIGYYYTFLELRNIRDCSRNYQVQTIQAD
jgi:hypothetical protein